MRNSEPMMRPRGYLTMKQWAEKEKKFPINTNDGNLCYIIGQGGRKVLGKDGRPALQIYYAPDAVRELCAEDEKFLMQKYKSYKPVYLGKGPEADISLDRNLGLPIRKVIEEEDRIDDEWDEKVRKVLEDTPFNRMDTGKIIAYDTETTGVGKTDEVLQITVLKENGDVLFSSYIKPYRHKEWPGAQEVHHISPEMVKDAPYPHEVAPLLRDIFMSAEEILGYNIMRFDNRFMSKNFQINLSGKTGVDPIIGFNSVNLPHHKLGNAVEYYCPEALIEYNLGAHDAATDVRATIKVYHAFEEKYKKTADEIFNRYHDELIKCQDIKDMEYVRKCFESQGKETLKDPVMKKRADDIFEKVSGKEIINVEDEVNNEVEIG